MSKFVNYENITKDDFKESQKNEQPADNNWSKDNISKILSANWDIFEVFETNNESKLLKMCAIRAIIFFNQSKKQMVLAFKGFDAEFTDIIEKKNEFFQNCLAG
jgi:hypothetical protein